MQPEAATTTTATFDAIFLFVRICFLEQTSMRKQSCRKWTMAGMLAALFVIVFVYDATLSHFPFFEYIYIFSMF